jgi:hypothetical protein
MHGWWELRLARNRKCAAGGSGSRVRLDNRGSLLVVGYIVTGEAKLK